MQVHPTSRTNVLRYASLLTVDKHDPVAVAINATQILAWLEDAHSKEDQQLREQALSRHYANTCMMPPDDDPDRFVLAARRYYAFLTAGGGETP